MINLSEHHSLSLSLALSLFSNWLTYNGSTSCWRVEELGRVEGQRLIESNQSLTLDFPTAHNMVFRVPWRPPLRYYRRTLFMHNTNVYLHPTVVHLYRDRVESKREGDGHVNIFLKKGVHGEHVLEHEETDLSVRMLKIIMHYNKNIFFPLTASLT